MTNDSRKTTTMWQEEVTDLRAQLEAAEKWRHALENAAIVDWVSVEGKEPQQIIQDIVAWNQKIALDPAVSADAQRLVDLGKAQADVLLRQAREALAGLHSGASLEAWEARIAAITAIDAFLAPKESTND